MAELKGREGGRGSYPSECGTSGAGQTLMLKNKDVENKEGEEQSCIHSSQEEKLM